VLDQSSAAGLFQVVVRPAVLRCHPLMSQV
jgi:hypothetical protein